MKRKQKERKTAEKETTCLNLNREQMEQEIRNHAAGLKEELNLRSVCQGGRSEIVDDSVLREMLRLSGNADLWAELSAPGNILWVDDIEITGITYHERKQKEKSFRSRFECIPLIKKFVRKSGKRSGKRRQSFWSRRKD